MAGANLRRIQTSRSDKACSVDPRDPFIPPIVPKLTVIANAPNLAGQALLSRFFGRSVSPLGLAAGALLPTVIAAVLFRLF